MSDDQSKTTVDRIAAEWLHAGRFCPSDPIEMRFDDVDQFKNCIRKVLELAGVKDATHAE